MEREPTPSTSTHCEAEGEELAGCLVAIEMSLGEETPVSSPVPLQHLGAPPVATQVSDPAPPTCTSSMWGRRRTPRVTDRQLQETEALSFIQRVDADDRFDLFGHALASSCRQLPTERQEDFMCFSFGVVADFHHTLALPEVGGLLTRFRQALGPRRGQFSDAVSTATQRQNLGNPAPYPAPYLPTARTQFVQSFLPCPPTSSGPQPTASRPSTPPRYHNFY
ncbi:uncharacterized protein LOC142664248 [Rhinoderma darwinii]|uniref:uncharacterized protein LOC142664248 n=1 Tax=Rhinoderma darwinii TaxID=43563 RepID=UPI003F67077B